MEERQFSSGVRQVRMRLFASGSIAGILVALSAPAMAQGVGQAQAAVPDQQSGAAADATPLADNDIIVTAQRRGERLQDVPIAVTAIGAQQLAAQRITSTADLTQVTPGLNFTQSANHAQPFIRGIGSLSVNLGDESSVATYVDGVYVAQSTAVFYQLADVERVEVLKGPQGTLFGRNATGGAISITTRTPQATPTGDFRAGYGNYNALRLSGYVAGGSETVAASLAALYNRRDGYFNDRVRGGRLGDGHQLAISGKLHIAPTDRLTIDLAADHFEDTDPSYLIYQPLGEQILLRDATTILPSNSHDYVGNLFPVSTNRQTGGSVRVRYDAGAVDLISISGYRESRAVAFLDQDTTNKTIAHVTPNTESSHAFSQEFQAVSTGDGPFNWIVGAYYFDYFSEYDPLLITRATGVTALGARARAKAYAVYADGTYKFGDVSLTLGLRYSDEEKHYTGSANGVVLVNDVKKNWNAFTPRAVLSYRPQANVLLYGSFARGFKSGVFNTISLSPTPIDPENVNAYEIGLKSSPSRLLTLNLSAFWYDASNVQVSAISSLTNLPVLQNAASARSRGIDLDLRWRPVPEMSLRLGASYLDARYRVFRNAQVFIPNPASTAAGFLQVSRDVSGNHRERSPEFTFNLGADYAIPLNDGGSLTPSINVFHTSKFYWEASERLSQGAYSIVNAQITWAVGRTGLSASIWAKNLGNADAYRSVLASAIVDRGLSIEPRTFGVEIGYRF